MAIDVKTVYYRNPETGKSEEHVLAAIDARHALTFKDEWSETPWPDPKPPPEAPPPKAPEPPKATAAVKKS